jgi:hypothetical protein
MSLSRFFIDRPIFAGVISAIIFLVGLITTGLWKWQSRRRDFGCIRFS